MIVQLTKKLSAIIKKLCVENNCKYYTNSTNKGRTETRQLLANYAKYDWILFLDADVIPTETNFLENYMNFILNDNFDIYLGGIAYKDKAPEFSKILRWKYGRYKETKSSKSRNKKPYRTIVSANLLIRKAIFKNVNKNLVGNHYGYDNVFSLKVKEKKYKILHIDNLVFHLGLETNAVYLRKKEQSAETIYMLYSKNLINSGDNGLLKAYETIRRFKLEKIIVIIFSKSKKLLKQNILGNRPSLLFLDFYRLGYFCKIKYGDK
ncbi:glycosyltransferase [Aquimarina agarivorans]|uniref:glycosyltransferase n=1 Tax=Aquimarina agarivorans TaxID=980584 RepID=UPI000248E98D|nr:glycosyltransferase [Aquimarina agarivorans]